LGKISIRHNNSKLNLSIKTGLKLNFTEIRNPDIKSDFRFKTGFESGFQTSFETEIFVKSGFESVSKPVFKSGLATIPPG
jgi:hypothetical protein